MRRLLIALAPSLVVLLSLTSSADSQGKKKGYPGPVLSDLKDAFGDRLPVGAVARIGAARYRLVDRHGNFQPVLSPDGKHIAVSGYNDELEILELPQWVKTRTIRGRDFEKKNAPYFQAVVFSHDAKKLVGADANTGQLFLIDLTTGKALKKYAVPNFKGRSGPPFMNLSRDEKTLVTGARNDRPKAPVNEILVIDTESSKIRHTIEIPFNNFDGRQSAPTISADGRWLVITNVDNTRADRPDAYLEFWDLGAGKAARKIELDMPMLHTAISPDSKWLAASNGQSILRIYDVANGKEIHNIRLRRSDVSHLEFAPSSAVLYVADQSGTVVRFDPVRGERLGETRAPIVSTMVRQIAFTSEGKAMALAQYADSVHYWEVDSGKMLSPTGVPGGMIDTLVFSPKGELFVASEDGHSAWWDPKAAVKLRDLKLEMNEAFNLDGPIGMPIGGMNFQAGGTPYRRNNGGMINMASDGGVLTVGEGGMVSVFDAKTGKLLYDDDSRNGRGTNLCFVAGGQQLASQLNKKVRVWNARSGRDLYTFDVPLRQKEFATRMVASENGKHFVFGTSNEQGQGRVLLWDVDKKEVAREWNTQDRADAMGFSADNQWLAITANRDQVRLLRVARSRGEHTLALGKRVDEVTQFAFSPDSRQLACAAIVPLPNFDSSKIVIFEVASKMPRLELAGHYHGIIERLAFSHEGALLASGATDTTVLLWRAGLRAYLPAKVDKKATPEELDEHFKELSNSDAKAAFQRMIKLVQTPEQSVQMLGDKIAPAEKVTSGDKTVPQWIKDLASSQFQVRNRANTVLMKIGASVEPELKAALGTARDVETKRRIEALLEHFAAHEWTPEEVRHARVVEIVESIGTTAARAVLERWSKGDPGAILTSEASVALKRLP